PPGGYGVLREHGIWLCSPYHRDSKPRSSSATARVVGGGSRGVFMELKARCMANPQSDLGDGRACANRAAEAQGIRALSRIPRPMDRIEAPKAKSLNPAPAIPA